MIVHKKFSLVISKVIGAILASFLLAISSVTMANASDMTIKNKYNDLYINAEVSTIDEISSVTLELTPELFISHAGGRVRGKAYTNSRESLDKSYENGYRFIELDFEWTTDRNLALIHDWDGYVISAFDVEPRRYSTEEFKSFNMIEGLTQMVLEDLAEWLYEHRDVYIVTDIKGNNTEGLKIIKERYPDLITQFIPQVYRIEQYFLVQNLGYENIILTLYASNYTDEEIIDFVKLFDVFAITMPVSRSRTELPRKLKDENVFVYAHTINNNELRQELELYGIDGFYTDDLLPSGGGDPIDKAKEYNLVTEKISSKYYLDITREELCELIVRMYEEISGWKAIEPETNHFIDTYNPEVLKAYGLGIVNGTDETEFSPNAYVTREEIATMLYRTIKTAYPYLTAEYYEVSFADKEEISNWALEAIGFMSKHKILTGVGNNRVDPKGNVTREQSILLVKRTYEKFKLQM